MRKSDGIIGNAGDLLAMMARHNQVVLLTDDNVAHFCLPRFKSVFGFDGPVIQIPDGERHKTLDTVSSIWTRLMDFHADRNTLLVNLGGGVVSDLGGFAAACFNRGIPFVNVPTTLLAMVDASVGGKTGFDFMGVKNKIGTFADAELVCLNVAFLDTLPQRQLLSGLSEMIKYGFIAEPHLLGVNIDNYREHVKQAVLVKQEIVAGDKYDHGRRRMLNFGHTIGHSLEALCIGEETALLHGEAVAMGMFCALYISHKRHRMPVSLLERYVPIMKWLLGQCDVVLSDAIIGMVPQKLLFDKKNIGEKPVFVLLDEHKECVFDANVGEKDVDEALTSLQSVLAI